MTTTSPTILITGATGNVGSELVNNLVNRGIPVRALVRTAETATKLSALKGVETVVGDFADPLSIVAALNGIEKAFLLTNSSEQAETLQNNFVDSASKTGLKHIVKLSQFAADEKSPVRFLRYHAAVEQTIRQSGINHTFLRPNLYMQGLLGFRHPIIHQGTFFAAIADATISLIDIRDIADVAAETLTKLGHDNKTYDLTGPAAISHRQMADTFSKVLGRNIRFIDVTPNAMQQALIAAGFPPWQADGLLEDYAHYSRGEASALSTAVKDITGKPPRRFESFIEDYKDAFLS